MEMGDKTTPPVKRDSIIQVTPSAWTKCNCFPAILMTICIVGCLAMGLGYILSQLRLIRGFKISETAVVLSMVNANAFAWLLLGNKRFFDGGQPTAFIKALFLILINFLTALGLGLLFKDNTSLLCRALTIVPCLWYLLMGLFKWARPYTTIRTHPMMGLIDW